MMKKQEKIKLKSKNKIVTNTLTLHNGMILPTLSISSHDFVLGFPKDFMERVFLDYKS